MPKEPRGDAQACVGETGHSSRLASKTAKDKSNSAALLASRARAEQESSGRGSRCSEKDSGYSDTGSDSLQTDSDERQSVKEHHVRKSLCGSEQSPLSGAHILVPGAHDLTPIFIIKNVVLKQPAQSSQEQILPSSLSWGGSAQTNHGPTHVLLLQQPGMNQSGPMHISKPSQRSESRAGKKSKNTYLPILNSYPRIAPHPSKKSSEKPSASRSGSTDEHILSKRVCTEEKREEVSTTTQAAKQHLRKQLENTSTLHPQILSRSLSKSCESLAVSHQHWSSHRSSSPSASISVGSPSVSSTQTPSPPSCNDLNAPLIQARRDSSKLNDSGKGSNLPSGSARHRRFLNTVEILSQSGLLDITLRTQDLLRQNTATERDIAQLRQHAQLLCQAARAGSDAPAAWEKLQQAMAESGNYPSLKCQTPDSHDGGDRSQSKVEVEAATSTKPDSPVIYAYGRGTENVAPPSPLLAPMLDAESSSAGQLDLLDDGTGISDLGRVYRGTLRPSDELMMPPDSSTHVNQL